MSDLERDAAVLAQHWREATGMTLRSPDRCACGVETRPADNDGDILDRRARAFAQHQAEVLDAARRRGGA